MKKQFLTGYLLVLLFVILAIMKGNNEFIAYAAATVTILGIIHYYDRLFSFNEWALWGLDLWMLMHILGGLFDFRGDAVYNLMILPIVGEPYNILKYDQVVHMFCYFIMAILMWSVMKKITNNKSSFTVIALVTVLAATGIGGINEIIEFGTTIFFETNVGGYENTVLV